jgi:hypothetical protein
MNCIDAVEGTVKSIISRLHQGALENRLDDTEFIREVKTVIEASTCFVQSNREILAAPEVLTEVLYRFAKALWLERAVQGLQESPALSEGERGDQVEYFNYFFDHLYAKGTYPR